ncbi:GNAT family N-acetyltransferase [Rouxiella sp. Mn2063]|uniref:GNAT family N-acetyltransferase n=1 Tax=Rouxiella sp. Mn2063 TaxID=3395262 RepID=UPI003BE145B8
MSVTLTRVELFDHRFVALVNQLDSYQKPLYPATNDYTMPLEVMAQAESYPLLAEIAGTAVGCACLYIADGIAEIKRVFVDPHCRGQGIAVKLVQAVELQARKRNISRLYLETGIYQPHAVGLYRRLGFQQTECFGSYIDDPLSVYMVKDLAG